MITKKTKYALMALSRLAEGDGGEPVLIADLAERDRIPRKFLEAILVSLRKGGILRSRVGKGGGYLLARPPEEIAVGEVARILEGELAPLPCLREEGAERCGECADARSCGIRLVMGEVVAAARERMDGISVAEMVARSRAERQRAGRVLDFSI